VRLTNLNLKARPRQAQAAEFASPTNRVQVGIGAFLLILGVVFYVFDRSPHRTWLFTVLPLELSAYGIVPRLPSWLNGSLPAFLHGCSLTVVTASLLVARASAYVWIAVSWLLIHVLFELGQGAGRTLVELTPQWVDLLPMVGNVRSYFVRGTFDEADIVAAFLGCACGFGILMLTSNREAQIP
jgi:hypothetical protein